MRLKSQRVLSLVLTLIVISGAVMGCNTSVGSGSVLSKKEATIKLNNKIEKMSSALKERDLGKDLGDGKESSSTLLEELPDLETEHPPKVIGNGDIVLKLASSPEKANDGTEGSLNEIAKKFNSAGYKTADGKSVSISVTSIASGEAVDYIKSGKYVWDLYTPSNAYWGEILEAEGVQVTLKTDRLAGNTAGFVLAKKEYETFMEKYKEVTAETITQAVIDGELSFGYTNPLASSTGVNFLLSLLYGIDSENPLSSVAKEKFISFSENINHLSYTTLQIKTKAANGSIKAFVYEYQAYKNTPELSEYPFIPFGLRHDNPVYAIGALSGEREEAVNLFMEYCLSAESQAVFSNNGFNQYDDYRPEDLAVNGNIVLSAQKLWKSEKNTKEIAVIFVEDVSGSMEGEPIYNMKNTLIELVDFIGDTHHVGMVTYDNDVYVDLPIKPFDDSQKAYFRGAVNHMSAGSQTSTNNALLVAMQMLLEYQETNPDIKPLIILMSDGEQTSGYDLNSVTDIFKGLGIPIHTVAYNTSASDLETLASLNEAATINATSDNVLYKLKAFFNAEF